MCKKCANINGAIVTKRKGRKAEVDVPELVKAGVEVAVGFLGSNFITDQVVRVLPTAANFTGIVKVVAGGAAAMLASKSSSSNKDDIVNVAVGMVGSGVLDIASKVLPDTLKATLGINAPLFVGQTRTRTSIAPAAAARLAPNPSPLAANQRVLVRTAQ